MASWRSASVQPPSGQAARRYGPRPYAAAGRVDEQRRRPRIHPGSLIEAPVIRGLGDGALEADGGQNLQACGRAAIAGWIRARCGSQRSVRLAEASKSPFSVRVAATGTMRSTPSSVAFSTIHSKRSNLMIDASRVMETTGRGAGMGSMIAKHYALAARLRDFGEIGGVVVGDFVALAGLDAEHAGQMAGLLAVEFGESVAQGVDKEAAACHCLLKLRLLKYKLMIALLRGVLLEKHPNQAVVEAGGVGYDVTIPVSTYTHLPETGAEVRLRIHTHVREDALALYGFLTQDEKALFEKLIGVSGIGPTLAVKVLSGVTAVDLVNAIRRSEMERLVRIPGVGKKTAERMVVELRDKLPAVTGEEPATPAAEALSPVEQDVLSALLNLGCARPQAEAAVRKAKAAGAPAEFEPLFRRALELVR